MLSCDPSASSTASTSMRSCRRLSSTRSTRRRRRAAPRSRRRGAGRRRDRGAAAPALAELRARSGSSGCGAMSTSVTSTPERAGAGGDLAADEAGADDQQAPRRAPAPSRSATASSRSRSVCTPSSSAPGPCQCRARAAGGDDQAVISEPRSVGQPHAPVLAVEPGRRARRAASRPRARRVRRPTPRGSCVPCSSSFDSGGRVYGRCGSCADHHQAAVIAGWRGRPGPRAGRRATRRRSRGAASAVAQSSSRIAIIGQTLTASSISARRSSSTSSCQTSTSSSPSSNTSGATATHSPWL